MKHTKETGDDVGEMEEELESHAVWRGLGREVSAHGSSDHHFSCHWTPPRLTFLPTQCCSANLSLAPKPKPSLASLHRRRSLFKLIESLPDGSMLVAMSLSIRPKYLS